MHSYVKSSGFVLQFKPKLNGHGLEHLASSQPCSHLWWKTRSFSLIMELDIILLTSLLQAKYANTQSH